VSTPEEAAAARAAAAERGRVQANSNELEQRSLGDVLMDPYFVLGVGLAADKAIDYVADKVKGGGSEPPPPPPTEDA